MGITISHGGCELEQEGEGRIVDWFIALFIGGIIGWIGWYKFVKEVPGSIVGSMLAGCIGALLGGFGSAYYTVSYLWHFLLFAMIVACILVLIVDLTIRQVNIK